MLQPLTKPSKQPLGSPPLSKPAEQKRRFSVSAEIITSGAESSRRVEGQIQEIMAKIMDNADRVLHVRFSSRQAEKEAMDGTGIDETDSADR